MKFLGTKTMKIAALTLPGDWKKLLRSEEAGALSASLAHVPMLQRPGVRKSDRAVIWGRHRLAALTLAGHATAEVDLWSCTDDELATARDVENAFRRAPDADARLRLIERWTTEILREREEAPVRVSRDNVPEITHRAVRRPKEAKTEARERVAALAGVSPETLRKHEQRARKAEEKQHQPPAWGSDADGEEATSQTWLSRLDAFETWGLVHLMTEGFARQVVQTREAVTRLDGAFRGLLAQITGIEKAVEPAVFADLELQTLRTRLQQQASAIRAQYPVAICPWCKGFVDLMRHCRGCRGRAMVGREALDRAPAELRVGGEGAGVFVGPNEFRRLSELETA